MREVMPVIEQRIAAGVRLVDILKALKEGGIDLTEATLKSYLYRYRQKQSKPAAATRPADALPSRAVDRSEPSETERSEDPALRGPISMQALDRLMKPDPAEQAEKLARYERLAKQQRRSRR